MPWRKGALLCALLLGSLAAAEATRPRMHLFEVKAAIRLDEQVPKSFGEWREDTSITPVLPDPTVQAKLDELYTQVLARTYVNRKGTRVMLSIAYGSDQSSEATAVHRPEFCYSAQGFTVRNLGVGTVEFGQHQIAVQRLRGELGRRYEPITYWITLDETATLPGVGRKLEQMRYGLRGQIPDGMLVRVSTVGLQDSEAYRIQSQFIEELYAQVSPSVRARYFGS